MKKIQGIDKEIKKLKAHLNQLTLNDKTKSMGGLLNKENILRKKMKIILMSAYFLFFTARSNNNHPRRS